LARQSSPAQGRDDVMKGAGGGLCRGAGRAGARSDSGWPRGGAGCDSGSPWRHPPTPAVTASAAAASAHWTQSSTEPGRAVLNPAIRLSPTTRDSIPVSRSRVCQCARVGPGSRNRPPLAPGRSDPRSSHRLRWWPRLRPWKIRAMTAARAASSSKLVGPPRGYTNVPSSHSPTRTAMIDSRV